MGGSLPPSDRHHSVCLLPVYFRLARQLLGRRKELVYRGKEKRSGQPADVI